MGNPVVVAGKQPSDQLGRPVNVAANLKFQDGASSPIVSPASIDNSAAHLITVPAGATVFRFKASGVLRYGDNDTLDGSAGKGYRTAMANVEREYQCAGATAIYLKGDAGTVAVDFSFDMLGV